MKLVLSIDGGGIRGLIPAIVLRELESRYRALNGGKPLAQVFELIAGTSTGGIIAAGLCAPKVGAPDKTPAMTPDDLVTLYEKHGGEIFDRSLFRRIRSTLFDERFDAVTLESLLRTHLGDTRLSQAIGTVMMTAYDIRKRETVFMKGPKAGSAGDFRFREAARATSAAPTYFEPALVENLTTGEMQALVDGGVFNNQPAMSAYVEARKMGARAEDIVVVSLGTGYQTRAYSYNDARNWGSLAWISPLKGAPVLSIMMHGQTHATDHHLDRLLNDGGGKRFYRFDRRLEDANDDMDDATEKNIEALKREAHRIINEQDAELTAVAQLMAGKTPDGGMPPKTS